MRILVQKLKQVQTILFCLVMSSGMPAVYAESTVDQAADAHASHKGIEWPGIYTGIYNGFLPCADCAGVKTSLALNKNKSYILITQYVGKSTRDFVEKGKFSAGDKPNTIILTPKKSASVHHYLVGEDVLIKLDEQGNRVSGDLADRYVLRRIDVTAEPISHSSH